MAACRRRYRDGWRNARPIFYTVVGYIKGTSCVRARATREGDMGSNFLAASVSEIGDVPNLQNDATICHSE